MSNNLENDRTVSSNKMYPIDLAPQKITIVKSVPNTEVKMTHFVSGQTKTTVANQIISHPNPIGLMRSTAQILSSTGTSQPHMIISSSPILQGNQIVSQSSQIIGSGTQLISQAQIIGPSGQIMSPGTQIISQGTQLNAQLGNVGSGPSNSGSSITQVTVSSSGSPVLNVGAQLVNSGGNLVVNSGVRTLPPSVRVLPSLPHHTTRPVLSNVSLGNTVGPGAGVVVTKTISSHVPRGPAAGASLAVPRVAARPVTPVSQSLPVSSLGPWASAARGVRGAVVYSARGARAPAPRPAAPAPAPAPAHASIVTAPSSTVFTSGVRGVSPRAATPTPSVPVSSTKPVPLVQRNYQPPAKVVGVASVRTPFGNSAPSQLYYEVPRAPTALAPLASLAPLAPMAPLAPRHSTPYQLTTASQPVNVLNTVRVSPENRSVPPASLSSTPALPRPSILRKRDLESPPPRGGASSLGVAAAPEEASTWERAGSPCESRGGGSTTESAASSPAPDDDPPSPPPAPPIVLPANTHADVSPRKKPRKQILTSEVRQCEYPVEEPAPAPSPAPVRPPPKRPQLSSTYVCGWRPAALHFVRPADVRRREPRPRDILAIAAQKHVLAVADGWKVHHLTAQMDDLISLESDVGEQLAEMLRTLETVHGKAQAALAPHSHTLLELVKGNIQRSRTVCEGVQEAREDLLRVFTHRTFVADILTRQADKRCFRKHRSQS